MKLDRNRAMLFAGLTVVVAMILLDEGESGSTLEQAVGTVGVEEGAPALENKKEARTFAEQQVSDAAWGPNEQAFVPPGMRPHNGVTPPSPDGQPKPEPETPLPAPTDALAGDLAELDL